MSADWALWGVQNYAAKYLPFGEAAVANHFDAKGPALKASWAAMVPSISAGDGTEVGLTNLKKPVMLWCGRKDGHFDKMHAIATKHAWRWLEVPGDHLGACTFSGSVAAREIVGFVGGGVDREARGVSVGEGT